MAPAVVAMSSFGIKTMEVRSKNIACSACIEPHCINLKWFGAL
jgi:hypothetical protein